MSASTASTSSSVADAQRRLSRGHASHSTAGVMDDWAMTVAHWDDVETHHRRRARWTPSGSVSVHEVRRLDCVIHRADEHEHTFVAGPEGLEYLVFGTRHRTEIGWLPRSRAVRIGWPWVEGRDDDPWDVEAGVEPLAYGDPGPRPA